MSDRADASESTNGNEAADLTLSRRRFGLAVLAGAALSAMAGELTLSRADSPAAPTESTTLDAGDAAAFAEGVSDKFAKDARVFVVRKGKTLSALSATCTHKKNLLKLKDGQIRCPAHGSRFESDGKCSSGPAKEDLPHYAVSIDAKGHLIVDKSKLLKAGDAGTTVDLK
jgi:cytochrome b6-f complex iron-sulfur subunit